VQPTFAGDVIRPVRPAPALVRALLGFLSILAFLAMGVGATGCRLERMGPSQPPPRVAAPPVPTIVPGPSSPGPTAPVGSYRYPVHRPVVDRFRPPSSPYGPGNRGWEFGTVRGDQVVAAGAGTVAFAGWVAGRGVVTVAHPDGLVSSLTGLTRIDVSAGQGVVAGQMVGVAGERLHLGFRRDGVYLDPALLLRADSVHAVLVPVP